MKKLFEKFTALLLGISFLLPISAFAENVVFATSEWEPYVISENGKPSGLDVEIVQELCKRLGLEPDIRILPWKRALVYMETGRADAIFAARHTEERARFLYYPSEPLNIERTVILALKGSGIRITKPDDLKGKAVGVVLGYVYGPEFDNCQGIKKDAARDDKQLILKLIKKRHPLAASSDEVTAKYLCKQAGAEAEVVYVLNETPSYIAFSKKRGEKGRAMAEKFSQMLRKLKEEGVIQKIESKYF